MTKDDDDGEEYSASSNILTRGRRKVFWAVDEERFRKIYYQPFTSRLLRFDFLDVDVRPTLLNKNAWGGVAFGLDEAIHSKAEKMMTDDNILARILDTVVLLEGRK